jgi:hypothetical protein
MKPIEIAVRVGGKVYRGVYIVEDEMVRVAYRGESKAALVGHSPPETSASTLLRELVMQSRHQA